MENIFFDNSLFANKLLCRRQCQIVPFLPNFDLYTTIHLVFLSGKPHPRNPEKDTIWVILNFSLYRLQSRQNHSWHFIFENHKIISPPKPKLSKSNFDWRTNTSVIYKPLKLGVHVELSRQPSTKPYQPMSLKHVKLYSAPHVRGVLATEGKELNPWGGQFVGVGVTGVLQRGHWERWGVGVPVGGCRELALCTPLARLGLCSSVLWCDLWELQLTGHTSPSWLALLTPCHILVGLRNSLFLFELIRTKKKKFFFLTEALGKAKGVERWRGAARLHFPKQSSLATFSCPRKPHPEVCRCTPEVVFWLWGVSFLLRWDGRGASGGVKKRREFSFQRWELDWLRRAASGR